MGDRLLGVSGSQALHDPGGASAACGLQGLESRAKLQQEVSEPHYKDVCLSSVAGSILNLRLRVHTQEHAQACLRRTRSCQALMVSAWGSRPLPWWQMRR